MLSIMLIACLGGIVYSNTFHCPFNFDDELYIVNNFAIRNIHDLLSIWKAYPCRFIALFSFAFNYHFNQLNVLGYHLFNLMVHLASAILVWWFVQLTFLTPAMKGQKIADHANIISLLAGLVFVAHPVQTEAVTYICQRAASMATFFYLASLCFYVKSRLLEDGVVGRKVYYICALAAAVAAMFTKEIAITLPLMVLLYEISFFEKKRGLNWSSCRTLVVTRKQLFPFLATLFIIPSTMLLSKSVLVQTIQGVVKEGISPLHYLLTQFGVMVTYIRLVFLPFNQNIDYDYPIAKSIFEFHTLGSLLFLMGILFYAKHLWAKHRLVSFSIFWFFLTLLPESSFLPLQDVIFEHRLYLPLVGYSILLVSGMFTILESNNSKTMVKILMVIIAGYSFLTYQRNKVWRDDLTLWNDTVQKSPHKARTYGNRGLLYLQQGSYAQAMSDLTQAITLNPDYSEAYNNRGLIYLQQGNFTQAVSDFTRAIALNANNAVAYSNRSSAYYYLKEYEEASADVKRAKEINGPIIIH